MTGSVLRPPETSYDRRSRDRMPIQLEVRYRAFGSRASECFGKGTTVNVSSRGVLFTTESALPSRAQMELSICWPAQLNGVLPLKLVVLGRVVRADDTQAAISIEKYEFKTRGSRGS